MPVTTDDLEAEFQEEQTKKAQVKAAADSKIEDGAWVFRNCKLMFACGVVCVLLILVVPMQPIRFQKDLYELPVPVIKEKATLKASDTPALPSDVPEKVRALAVELIGDADAKQFIATAVCTMKTYKKKQLWFWHNKKDDLDFNPDVNYQFPKLSKMAAGSLAVDVGANLGDTPVLVYTENQNIQILSFEPSPYNFIFMRWNLIRNGIPELTEEDFGTSKPGVLAMFGGATKDGRKIELAFAPEQTKHAQMKSDAVGFGYEIPPSIDDGQVNGVKHNVEKRYQGQWTTLSVPSFSLPAWLKSHNAPTIKWFKLDCEGCEYETLIDLEDGGFLKEAIVVGEAHYRHVADLTCEKEKSEQRCKDMITPMHRVRKLMCGKWQFSCCSKVMPCDIFQEKCTKKG